MMLAQQNVVYHELGQEGEPLDAEVASASSLAQEGVHFQMVMAVGQVGLCKAAASIPAHHGVHIQAAIERGGAAESTRISADRDAHSDPATALGRGKPVSQLLATGLQHGEPLKASMPSCRVLDEEAVHSSMVMALGPPFELRL